LSEVRKLPVVEAVQGLYFNPLTELVQLQFRSGEDLYEISFELPEIFKAEEWFIQLRQSLGTTMQERRNKVTG
jgi:hypothetical protein